jgi:hypothetical protein
MAKKVIKQLKDIETLVERFTITDSEGLLPILEVKLDGVSISIADLVSVANKLSSALNDRGCKFEIYKGKKQ